MLTGRLQLTLDCRACVRKMYHPCGSGILILVVSMRWWMIKVMKSGRAGGFLNMVKAICIPAA